MKLEPVAWATEDGRVSMAKTRDTCMPSAAKESFNIPLYAMPAGYVLVPLPTDEQLNKAWRDAGMFDGSDRFRAAFRAMIEGEQ